MKKALLFFFYFLASCGLLTAQSWFEGNPQWDNYYVYEPVDPGHETVTISHDTVLGPHSAKVLKRFRDMTITDDKVGYKMARQNGDTIWCWNHYQNQFFIHYNFSLTVGDSVAVPIGYGNDSFKYVIDSVGILNVSGQPLRFQRIAFLDWPYNFWCTGTIIEKIGMLSGECYEPMSNEYWTHWRHFFLDEPNMTTIDGPGLLFCHFQNNQFTYQVPNSQCDALVGTTKTIFGSPLAISPNPFQDDFTITLLPDEKITLLRLFDISGKIMLQISDPAETKIHANDLPPGVYFLEILTIEQKR